MSSPNNALAGNVSTGFNRRGCKTWRAGSRDTARPGSENSTVSSAIWRKTHEFKKFRAGHRRCRLRSPTGWKRLLAARASLSGTRASRGSPKHAESVKMDGCAVLGWLERHILLEADGAASGFFLCRLLPPRPTFAQDMTAEEATVMRDHAAYWADCMKGWPSSSARSPARRVRGVWELSVGPMKRASACSKQATRRSGPSGASAMRYFPCSARNFSRNLCVRGQLQQTRSNINRLQASNHAQANRTREQGLLGAARGFRHK
jgi:hypothetical protein